MSVTFWAAMIVMLLVAVSILVYPLLKVRAGRSVAYKDSNLELHEEKLKELNNDLSEGRIDQVHYKVARLELDRELLGDVPVESTDTADLHYAQTASRQPTIAMLIAVFLPALSLLVYMQLGMHTEVDAPQVAAQKPLLSVEEMTTKLDEKLRNGGGSVEEWAMLGRAYKHLGDYTRASDAFATAMSMSSADTQLMLEQAESLALANERRFNEKSRSLILDALSIEPDNVNALWFAGVAEFQFGNYRQSMEHLSRLSAQASEDDEINQSVRFYLTKAREQLISAGEDVPDVNEMLAAEPVVAAEKVTVLRSLQVSVDISKKARKLFDANDLVFVYAKAAKGPRLPLAVQRMTLAELPATVVLDDTMAMVEGMNLSAFDQLVVSARVTKTGSAMAQSGDYIGQVEVDDVAAVDVLMIDINAIVP